MSRERCDGYTDNFLHIVERRMIANLGVAIQLQWQQIKRAGAGHQTRDRDTIPPLVKRHFCKPLAPARIFEP